MTRESLYDELNAMNGDKAYSPGNTVGPVTYSPTDRRCRHLADLRGQVGVLPSVGKPFMPEFVQIMAMIEP